MYGKVQLLRDKTLESFNIDTNTTIPKTLQLVYVSCERCGEVFTRQYHISTRLHRCSIYRTLPNGIKIKWCNNCQQFLSYDQFGHDRSSRATEGLAGHCLKCTSSKARTNRKDFSKWLHSYFITKQSMCKMNNTLCDLSEKFILELWNLQNGKCYYSDVDLVFNNAGLAGASLDRIDPTKGYIRENVVWCSRAINRMKQDNSYSDVSEFLMKATFNKFRG